MSEPLPTHSLLAEIEARQDEVLRQLDELDKQICRVLADYAASCQPAVAGATAKGSAAGVPAPAGEPATVDAPAPSRSIAA
jgi:hypothetical protein